MNRLLSDRRVVVALSLAASAMVYLRVVAPLMSDPAISGAAWEGTVDDGTQDASSEPSASKAQLKLATAQYDLRNIDIGALSFNESPARDPFTDVPVDVTPLPEVDLTPVKVVAATDTPRAHPARGQPTRPQLPRLTAIAFADDDRAAVLEDRIVRTGDRYQQFEITAIERRHVELHSAADRTTFTLTLTP